MEDTEMQDTLREALEEADNVRRIETFEEAGVLTRNAGLVIRMTDGSEFQVTVVRSR
jgi:hypothetical protein